ncbi:MAG: right-handed parallel beta-helix repeat-containing protein [Treponema sp.]|jgi:hypothetical protein|nr:right-handed parallel beta-helix repeat-containing protein [Treponema sp.]
MKRICLLSLLQNSVSFAKALAISRQRTSGSQAAKYAFFSGCNCKTGVLQLPLLICAALILGGCQNFFSRNNSQPKTDIPEGYGAARINCAWGPARTVLPDAAWEKFAYKFAFLNENEAECEFSQIDGQAPNNFKFLLKPGNYTLSILAFIDDESAAEGTESLTVLPGKYADLEIALYPTTGKGTGSLEIKLSMDGEFSIAAITLGDLMSAEEPYIVVENNETPNDDFDCQLSPPEPGNNYTSTLNIDKIPSGCYLLQIRLSAKNDNDTLAAFKTDVIYIGANLTTTCSYQFVADALSPSFYFVTDQSDDINKQGTLRYALSMAQDSPGAIIKILLPPDSRIELEEHLVITRDITIEGNGVTITCKDNGPTRLMQIGDNVASPGTGEGPTVKISRVHFKKGVADSSSEGGGAIYIASGELTLESCIFSGNKASGTGTNTNGGAIYCDGSTITTIKGCTFYINSADDGGAIYNNGTLELQGNLFYKNITPANGTVVSSTNPPVVVMNRGYNVVDEVPGGWTFVAEDTTFAALGIDHPFNTVTFEPLSALRNIMPGTAIGDFPTTDFYGELRDWPGAPGAVK